MPRVLTGTSALTIDLGWQDANQTWSGDWRQYYRHQRRRDWSWPQPNVTIDQIGLWIENGTGNSGNYTASGPQVIAAQWADTNATVSRRLVPQTWVQTYAASPNLTITGTTFWDGTSGTLWQDGIAQSPELTARYRREQERARLRQARASKRGRKLLLSLLTEEQQRQYAATQCFTVLGENGLLYRLRKRRTAELVGPDGGSVANYCIHLSGSFCAEDNLIALKFLLETDVPEFERIANITVIRDRLYKQIKASAGKPRLLRAA